MNSGSYEEIMKLAIKDEVEAFEFNNSAAQKVSDPSLKQIFLELANEEKNHRLILEGFLNHPSKPLKFSKVVDYKIADTINSPILSIDMKPADAIALAIKKEEEAMNVYSLFSQSSSEPEQARIFEELATMEQGHKVKLEELYTNMAFPEVW